jgi:hypothetical protein
MAEVISGVAKYTGTDEKKIKQFGSKYHVMFNSEGDYVRTKKNKQVVLDNDWLKLSLNTLEKENWMI